MHSRSRSLRLPLWSLPWVLLAMLACSQSTDDRLAIVVKLTGVTAQVASLEVSAVLNGKLATNSTVAITADLSEFVVYLPGSTEGELDLDIGALPSTPSCQLARAQLRTTVHPAPPRVVELTAALQSASPPLCPLTINLTGNGSVKSQPGELFCNTNRCRGVFAQGASVVLTAVPGSGGADQVVWSPACPTPGTSCSLKITQPTELTALFCSPTGWCQHNAPIKQTNLRGVWSSGPSNVWVVGAGGTVAHYDGKAWTAVPVVTNPNYSFYSVASTGPSDIVIGGSLMTSGTTGAQAEGAIFSYNGSAWTQVATPVRTVRDVWLAGATSGRAVGDAGLLYYRSGTSWLGADLTNSGKVYWSAWSTGSTEYIVGTGGFIGLASPGTTSVQPVTPPSPTANTLVSVFGTSSTDVWAAGYGCTLAHYDGTWTVPSPSCASTNIILNGVWGSAPNDYWAVLKIKYNSSRRLWPMRTQRRTKAVGYVRVSSEQQANEGVSLDAQRHKMRAYCKAMDIDLIDVIADEGYSASNLKRPGLQAALTMLRSGKACTLIVVKLDRLTRCVKDLGTLCEQYFSDDKPYTLLSLSDSINTRSASGKLVLNVLTSVAQWEREAIADRTKEAMAHLKLQGVKLGGVPYGWRYSSDVDANGRRLIVKHPEEQKAIKRICSLHDKQVPAPQIVQRLEQEGLPPRGKRWHTKSVYQVLTRAGRAVRQYRQDAPRVQPTVLELKRDKQAAAQRAVQLRAQRLSLRDICARLLGEGLLPPRGAQWYAATVLDLLPRAAAPRPTAGCARHEPPRGCASSRCCAPLPQSPQRPEANKLQRSELRRCAPRA